MVSIVISKEEIERYKSMYKDMMDKPIRDKCPLCSRTTYFRGMSFKDFVLYQFLRERYQ